jgi:DNA helicase-2/ATP-dependent DNA helicase PcrA
MPRAWNFPVVFIVGAEEGFFRMRRSLMEPMEMEEERRFGICWRNAGKERLYMTYAQSRMILR